MSPKSLLRHPLAASPLAELTSGTFRPVIDDPLAADRAEEVTRIVFCSGKVAIDLESSSVRAETRNVAIVRVEQLAPFQNTAIGNVLTNYPNLQDVVWLQEEPRNMGAWTFMESRLRDLIAGHGINAPLRYLGRIERSSPAEGSLDLHNEVQARIVAEAFADAPPVKSSRAKRNGKATNGKTSNGLHAEEPVAASTKSSR